MPKKATKKVSKVKKNSNKTLAIRDEKDNLTFSTNPIGRSGTYVLSGVYSADHIASLRGYEAALVYNKMARSDSQVVKILRAIIAPIKKATWMIEPASDETKDIEVASLIEKILIKDLKWKSKLSEILTCIKHGYSVFEPIVENKEDPEYGLYTGLRALAFRSQETLTEWHHNETTGELEKIVQSQSGDIEAQDIEIPASNLLIFFVDKEGDDNGTSILRGVYGAYKRKLLLEELKIIGSERAAIPIPKLKVPSGIKTSSQEYKDAITVLQQYTQAQNAYITYPEGWELELVGSTFDPSKLENSIKREDEKIAGTILASFLELGTGGNSGAFALSNDQSDFFLSVIESFPDIITETINYNLIPSLVKMNYGDSVGVYPKLTYSGISDKAGKELMEIIKGYIDSNIIQKDEQLEDYVRKIHHLPKKAEGEMLENQESQEGADDDSSNGTNEVSDDSSSNDDNSGSDISKDEKIELSEGTIKLKTPKGLMKEEEEKILEVMKRNLKFIGDKYIADLMRNYKQLSKENKLKAIDNLKLGGLTKFKKELKGAITATATASMNQVKSELNITEDLKLSDNENIIKLYDPEGSFKFNEFSKLPKHVQLLLSRQSERIVEKSAEDLKNRVEFQFMSSEPSSSDEDIIQADIQNAAGEYVDGGSPVTASGNLTSYAVNDVRNSFFNAPEVLDQIHSFTYVNLDPKSAICQKLAGTTFSTTDPEAKRYQVPLHHNCKTYIRANLQTLKTKPKIDGIPAISKAEKASITLKGDCSCAI